VKMLIVMLCSLVGGYRCFEGIYHLHLWGYVFSFYHLSVLFYFLFFNIYIYLFTFMQTIKGHGSSQYIQHFLFLSGVLF
jgi:hypothetical protein